MAHEDKPEARGSDALRQQADKDVRREGKDVDVHPAREAGDQAPQAGRAEARTESRRVREAAVEKAAAHPLGAAAGGAGGAVAGALSGVAVGPVGSLAGAVAGAVLGAGAGSGGGAVSGPVVEGADAAPRWRTHWQSRAWGDADARYEDYAVAYEYGADAAAEDSAAGRTSRPWQDAEPELERGWAQRRGSSPLSWSQVREAVREAWQHVHEVAARVPPGDLRR